MARFPMVAMLSGVAILSACGSSSTTAASTPAANVFVGGGGGAPVLLAGSAEITFAGAVSGKSSELVTPPQCVEVGAASTLKTYPLNLEVKLSGKTYQVGVLVAPFTAPPDPAGYAFGGSQPLATLTVTNQADTSTELWSTASQGTGKFNLNIDGRGGSFAATGAVPLTNPSGAKLDVTGKWNC